MGEERWGGEVTMISRGVEISITGGGGDMDRRRWRRDDGPGGEMGGLSLGRSFFFSFFFVIMLTCFRYKKPFAALTMQRKKPINPITTARFTSS